MSPLLNEMKSGQSGKIESIGACNSKNCLEAMGFYPGMRVEVLAAARIMRVRLSGATLAIDSNMAKVINVALDINSKDSLV